MDDEDDEDGKNHKDGKGCGRDGNAAPALTAGELRELARVFPPGPTALTLLRRAGFPARQLPSTTGSAAGGFWDAVADAVAAGRIADGRLRVLAAACVTYPHNEMFRAAVRGPGGGMIRRVLVTGASRADRELCAIRQAARGILTVDRCPAASATDVRRILTVRPDVLHLLCRRERSALVFTDDRGEAHRTPATRLAALLAAYRRLTGARLRGVVLACGDGAPLAPLFAGAAEMVVAHRGPLGAEAAAAFAGGLYGLLGAVPAPADAVRLAAERTGRDGVVVLGGAGRTGAYE
ncbi:effector-associated domain EAD1-containing protein [Streptomyces sp. NPDC005336]|uniref:effector-associated domain EAD1-containing protein n=1 Tax=unclassified Streptomyces TaxID=2593676 RepID=UPI0033B8D149